MTNSDQIKIFEIPPYEYNLDGYSIIWEAFGKSMTGDIDEAIALASKNKDNYPQFRSYFYLHLATFYTMKGEIDSSLDILEEGLTKGIWWARNLFENIEGFKKMHENPRFVKIIEQVAEIEMSASNAAEILVRKPIGFNKDEKYPLILGLHGGAGTKEQLDSRWKFTTDRQLILASLQSSQMRGENMFTWMDVEKGLEDMKNALQILKKQFPISKIILAGESQGAMMAFTSAFSDLIPIGGVIAVIPAINEKVRSRLSSLRKKAKFDKKIKLYTIAGEKDVRIAETEKLLEEIEKEGMQSEYIVIPEMGHEIPRSFEEEIGKALDYILK